MKEFAEKYKRIDGKLLTEKQKLDLLKDLETDKKDEEDFDPRKHRLRHGIRNYKIEANQFTGTGVKLKEAEKLLNNNK